MLDGLDVLFPNDRATTTMTQVSRRALDRLLQSVLKTQKVLHPMDANVIAKLIEKTGKVDRSRALYVGYSRQPSVQSEALSFMTSRGKGKKLPVLTWPDGSIITKQAAETQLDFKISVVYRSSMMGNATAVEAALQRLYHDDLELGHRLC